MQVKIKYLVPDIIHITKQPNSDWYDLRASCDVEIKKGEHKLIPLGIAVELPKNYEAFLISRSSTFKNFSVIQTNAPGLIDESFCSNSDQWFYSAYALKDTIIHKNDRICQFRINKKQPIFDIMEVDNLEGKTRGGHGSTGIK
jgi:dUTP pyrophosphatase